MNKKIPIKTFAERLAAEAGVDADYAQKFVKAYFDEVARVLHTEHNAEIPGLGTFCLTRSALSPVDFEVSADVAAEINAPFEIFEAVEVPKDFDAAISCDEVRTESDLIENTEEHTEIPVQDPSGNDTENFCDKTIDDVAAEDENVATDSDISDNSLKSYEDNNEVIETSDNPDVTSESLTIPEDEEEFVSNLDTAAAAASKNKQSFGTGFILGLLLGLILGALALFGYVMYYVNASVV